MSNMRIGTLIVMLAALGFGCGSTGGELGGRKAAVSKTPEIGKADSADSADRSCQVVLRHVFRNPSADGLDYETDCSTGECLYVWRGQVDVAGGVAPETQVLVLYHLTSDQNWWEVAAEPLLVSTPGFRSYAFALSEHLFGPGAGEEQKIELVAFLRGADGNRLFDHNARPGDFENTLLNYDNNWNASDTVVCQPTVGDIHFQWDWNEVAYGARRQGGYLRLYYDLERLPDCRGTHNGYPCWDIVAHARFSPGGQEVSGSVRRLLSENGTPTNQAEAVPFVTTIPENADGVDIWFENYSGCGSGCRAWDSNYGQNYRFDIWPAADSPRCQGVERARGGHYEDDRMAWNDPACLNYDVAENFDASNCEFYLEGLGLGYVAHYHIPFRWLLAYLKVGQQEGEVLNVGLFTRYHDNVTGQPGFRYSLGVQEAAGLWRAGFAYLITGTQGLEDRDVTIDAYAFFIDVRRSSGEVVRLWQSHAGRNYRLDDAFSLATYTEYIPYGNIQWADQAAEVFDSQRSCGN